MQCKSFQELRQIRLKRHQGDLRVMEYCLTPRDRGLMLESDHIWNYNPGIPIVLNNRKQGRVSIGQVMFFSAPVIQWSLCRSCGAAGDLSPVDSSNRQCTRYDVCQMDARVY
jgi:hypothetical protein